MSDLQCPARFVLVPNAAAKAPDLSGLLARLAGERIAAVYAAADGTVIQTVPTASSGGWGNRVVLDNGWVGGVQVSTGYNHMSSYIVSTGQWVSRGQVIGYIGTTGLSTGCHLHFEVRINGDPVNPAGYL